MEEPWREVGFDLKKGAQDGEMGKQRCTFVENLVIDDTLILKLNIKVNDFMIYHSVDTNCS